MKRCWRTRSRMFTFWVQAERTYACAFVDSVKQPLAQRMSSCPQCLGRPAGWRGILAFSTSQCVHGDGFCNIRRGILRSTARLSGAHGMCCPVHSCCLAKVHTKVHSIKAGPVMQVCNKVLAYIHEKKLLGSPKPTDIKLDGTLGTFLTAPVSTSNLYKQLTEHASLSGVVQWQAGSQTF